MIYVESRSLQCQFHKLTGNKTFETHNYLLTGNKVHLFFKERKLILKVHQPGIMTLT